EVDMAANDAIDTSFLGFVHQRFFKAADDRNGVFNALLGPSAEGPILEAKATAHPIDDAIDAQGGVVGSMAHMREPSGVHDRDVELIAMDNEKGLAGGRGVDGAIDQLDLAEIGAEIFAQEFVVIARKIDDARASLSFVENDL